MKKEVVALVLAGGEGKRFWPLTTNKMLLPFFGKQLIEHSVSDVLPKNIARLVIVTNRENDKTIRDLAFSVPHKTVVQSRPLGMADAILSAESEIQVVSLLIVNGDDIDDLGMYDGVMNHARSRGVFGVIPGWKTNVYRPLGYLELDGKRVTGIKEKPGDGNEPSSYVDLVGYFISDSNELLREIKGTKSSNDDVLEVALSALMRKHTFEMYEHTGSFASLKYSWHVLDVMDELFKRMKPYRGGNVVIKSNVVIEGDVYIGDHVKIFENTKIVGPCYIGENTIIGNNTIIRASNIGANCVTGFNTDITRSYIGDNCWFHSNYIGDSVLEGDISMGSGAVLANLRLDDGEIASYVRGSRFNTKRTKLGAIIGEGVRIGVNVSIMPGVKIGKRSFVGAGVVLDKDLEDESFCIANTGYTTTKNTKTNSSSASREAYKKHIR